MLRVSKLYNTVYILTDINDKLMQTVCYLLHFHKSSDHEKKIVTYHTEILQMFYLTTLQIL